MIVCNKCGKKIGDDKKHFSRIEGFKRKDYCKKCWIEIGEELF